jgi:hypothetical protein
MFVERVILFWRGFLSRENSLLRTGYDRHPRDLSTSSSHALAMPFQKFMRFVIPTAVKRTRVFSSA